MYHNNLSLEDIIEDGVKEVWKQIVGYEGIYECSSLGRIKSLSRCVIAKKQNRIIKTRIKKQFVNVNGYLNIFLNKDSIARQNRVHRFIGEAFIENIDNKKCINHKNLIRTDNRVSNLEWVTNRENNLHSYQNGHKKWSKGKLGKDCKYSKIVYQYDTSGNLIKRFFGTMEAERDTGISHKLIGRVCLGQRPNTHGFVWKYKKQN